MSHQQLKGKLFVYSQQKRLIAFRTEGQNNSKHAVFIPGLEDGLLALDYVPLLAKTLDRLGYSFVQPLLSSSYTGYGTSSLKQDVRELDALIDFLINDGEAQQAKDSHELQQSFASASGGAAGEEYQAKDVILIGHSTGCQISTFYMKYGRRDLAERVRGVVLQAPVSDRENLAIRKDIEHYIEHAKRLQPHELMPREAESVPITAKRFLSLATKEGDDDMFSSDLTHEEVMDRLGHMRGIETAAFLSGADQFVPFGDGRSSDSLARHFARALGCESRPSDQASCPGEIGETSSTVQDARSSFVHVIDGADHQLTDEVHGQEFVAKVHDFVLRL